MRNPMMWGLYITLFMYFVGLSAGGLIVASAGRLFGATRLKPIVRIAVLEATVAVMIAALLLLPDIGRPDRVWHLLRVRARHVAADLGPHHRHRLLPHLGDLRVGVHARRPRARAAAGWRSAPARARRGRAATTCSRASSRRSACRRRSCCTPSPPGSSACRSRAASGTRRSWRRCSSPRRWSRARRS